MRIFSIDSDKETDFANLNRSAVLIGEFKVPIELKIMSLKNIMKCPRYQKNSYNYFLLRVELMMGPKSYQQASWDIHFPKKSISNSDTITLPMPECLLSTADTELYYNELPRETTWCFTFYGVNLPKDIKDTNNVTNVTNSHNLGQFLGVPTDHSTVKPGNMT